MTQLVYTREELLRSHDYPKPHTVGGRRLHGGFDENGTYISPRTLVRGPAIQAWTDSLRARGGDLMDADSSVLLGGARFPNVAQMKYLLQAGLDQWLWNSLTITGDIEGRGRMLAQATFPDFQEGVWEDVSQMGIGHLQKGLLFAHGIDEGGEPDKGIGGHDVMWYELRDLAFGERDFPAPEVPGNIGRETAGERELSDVPEPYAQTVGFLLNLLLIEFRAEIGFASNQALLRDPELFVERRAQADEAAEVIERIRTDEKIHVDSLRLYLGELRGVHLKTTDGGRKPGRDLIDPLWEKLVHWATVEQPKLMVEQQRKLMNERILAQPDGERIAKEFNALEAA